MKKRLLVLLAFGVSFAPPVFAEGSGVIVKSLAENKISEINPPAKRCERAEDVKYRMSFDLAGEIETQPATAGSNSGRAL